MSSKIGAALLRGAINLIMLIFSASCIFPLIWMFYSSFKTNKEFSVNILSLPQNWDGSNYIQAIKTGKMQQYFFNSLFNSLATVLIVLVVAFVSAYLLSRFRFRFRSVVYLLYMFGMLVPIHGLLIPIFIEFNVVGLIDKWFTLLFPYVAFGMPMALFLFESFIRSIPREIDEAAYMDGSGIVRTIFRIIMPVCRPVISTALILTFLNAWNEFPFALVLLKSGDFRTIPVGLSNFSGQYTVNYPQLMAAMSIAILPVILVYLLFSGKIIQGMAAGSVKG